MILAGLVVISLFATPASAATTYYVATTGSDANPGTIGAPWRTIQKAANAAPEGSTVQIRGGWYSPFVVTRPYLTFQRYGTEKVSVNANSSIPNAIRISATHDVAIRGLIAQNGPSLWGAGIRVERGSYRISITGSVLRNNRSYGLMVDRSTWVTVSNNEISGNETGIQISYMGLGTVVKGNLIHDNNRMIVNDSTPNNDRGANAITFYKATGWILVTGNTIFGHRAASQDYGYDGGAFEIYGSSNLNLSGNTMYNNQNVLETGTDGSACSNIKFIRNIAYGGPDGGRPSQGLVLRCMSSSLVANNTFDDLTGFVFYVTQSGGFVGSLQGLTIRNNISRQPATKTYSFQGIPAGLTIDRNLVWNSAGTSIAWVNGKGNTSSIATFRSWTGYETTGVQADPRFADGAFHLLSTSLAIDRGSVIAGITDGFLGLAPDLGRRETR